MTRFIVRLLTGLILCGGLVGCGGGTSSPDDAWRVAVHADAREVVFTKSELGWQHRGDPDAPLDQGALRTLLGPVLGDVTCEAVASASDDLAEYGLEPPVGFVTVHYGEGETQRTDVGHPSVDGRSTYLKRDGRVCLVPGALHDAVSWPGHRYLDRRIAFFSPGRLAELRHTSADGTFTITKNAGLWWVKGFGPASLAGVDQLVYGLVSVRAERWGAQRADWGPASHRIVWTLSDGEEGGLLLWDEGEPLLRICSSDGRCGYASDEQMSLRNAGLADVLAAEPFQQWLTSAEGLSITGQGVKQEWRRRAGSWIDSDGGEHAMPPIAHLAWSGGPGTPRPSEGVLLFTIVSDATKILLYGWQGQFGEWSFSARDAGAGEWNAKGDLNHAKEIGREVEIVGSDEAPIAQ